ncbi:putative RNA-directed DNA polymerase [Candidatus Rickettsiella viridis]|uniref:Putative RNA-directed DNA polymerase n=1 Tax=Candidatus Rickettsiella viridis TaxID=676208 RepID=A0A2Z5UTB7_9COXI|nr:reverse transcriptase family protein [Candidatus Rickettsiella viridis]BBB14729.1 putative RNA-directed DNA polymerase [Candidatus Rickettsiella viridis]
MSIVLSSFYPYKPISRLDSLAKVLSVDVSALEKIASLASSYYRENKLKNNRITYTVLSPLKEIQEKIKKNLLDKVVWAYYLHSYIKKRNTKTNATAHLFKKALFNKDIKKYFDNCKEKHIYNVWSKFFNFTDNVASILTKLTIRNGELPQGSCTSPSLSNLIFWKDEPRLVSEFNKIGLAYTRYADDISVSSKNKKLDKVYIIGKIYGMFSKNGFKPAREKHKIYNSSEKMVVNGQTVNSKNVTLDKKYILKVRSYIYKLEKRINTLTKSEFDIDYQSILGKINYIKQYNKKGLGLESRLNKLLDIF